MPELTFEFSAELWLWSARRDSWTFVTLPDDASDDIRDFAADMPRGFGSVRVRVTLGESTWSTSVFPQSGQGPYVLPIKRAVRDANGLDVGDEVNLRVEVLL